MRPAVCFVLPVLMLSVGLAACAGASSVGQPATQETVVGTAEPPPSVRFLRVGLFATECPPALPVKVTAAPAVISPGDAAYAAATPVLCYDTSEHALQDTATRRSTAAPSGSGPAAPSTPLPLAVAAAGVSTRLRASAVAPSELPAGFRQPAVGAGALLQSTLAAATGLIGEVDVTMTGPDARDLIAYLVFPSEDDAIAAFAAASLGADVRNPVIFTPYGFEYPVKCASAGTGAASGELYGITACIARLGYVEVVGYSALSDSEGNLQHGNHDNAIALARAGVQHFEQVNR